MVKCEMCKKGMGIFGTREQLSNNKMACSACAAKWKGSPADIKLREKQQTQVEEEDIDEEEKKPLKEANKPLKKTSGGSTMGRGEKWEYFTQRYDLSFFNKPKQQKEEFDKLGQDGWELVAVIPIAEPVAFTSVPVTKAVIAYFKRSV